MFRILALQQGLPVGRLKCIIPVLIVANATVIDNLVALATEVEATVYLLRESFYDKQAALVQEATEEKNPFYVLQEV